jgi:hypothetical protein
MTFSLGLAQTNLQFVRQLADGGADPEAILQIRRDYDTACLLFGDRIRSSGKPFLCHLVGTASALAREGAQLAVVRAGLMHAAFSHGRFLDGRGGATDAHRRWLRARLGEEVEDLVHAYSGYRFDDDAIDRALADPDSVAASERTLMLMRVCNRIDDSLDFAVVLGGKAVYRDPTLMDRLWSLSVALGFDFCAEAAAQVQAEIGSSDWLRTDEGFRHESHGPTVLQVLRRVLRRHRGSGKW